MRAAFVALCLLLLVLGAVSGAQAQGEGERVDILDVRVPEQTVAGHPFPVYVTLRNHGPGEAVVSLFGALYPKAPGGGSPCGSLEAEGGTFTHMLQPRFRIQPGEVVTYPNANEAAWLHRYAPENAPMRAEEREFCIFAFDPERTARIDYYDYEPLGLRVRATNSAPEASFEFPDGPHYAARAVSFQAYGSDADGDPLVFEWDFGHANAQGRARAEGAEVRHAFYPADTYTVTLKVGDGFTWTNLTRTITVLPEVEESEPVDVRPADGGARRVPLGPGLLLIGAAVALAVRRVSR